MLLSTFTEVQDSSILHLKRKSEKEEKKAMGLVSHVKHLKSLLKSSRSRKIQDVFLISLVINKAFVFCFVF